MNKLANSTSNKAKSMHGLENQQELYNILHNCLDNGYISDVVKEFRAGSIHAVNQSQFYAPFMIQFSDRSRWIIYTTTSFRSDRIKEQLWDALNLKEVDTNITKAILVYSDSNPETAKFQKQNEKYKTLYEISSIDHIICFSELLEAIKGEFYKGVQDEINLDPNIIPITSDSLDTILTNGQIWDKEGKNFEKQIATILSSSSYLTAWKNNKKLDDIHFPFFEKLLNTFELTTRDILKIEATAEKEKIGYLPSGGSPKTDVLVSIYDKQGNIQTITLSCKRSKKDSVSVHQYSADVFADVLDPNNESLRKLLNDFQYYGNAKDLPDGVAISLKTTLCPYLRKLTLWAIGGIGLETDNPIHYAQYVVSYQTTKEKFSVYSVENYCDILLQREGAFGTPFYWTYASKHRGKCIQLKAPLL